MGNKHKQYELMIEIGQTSAPLKNKLPNGYTHKWTLFVRGINNSRIEHCIQRVVFQLHESFDNPQRNLTEPPFQVKETGYAGFEVPIEIYFKNTVKPNYVRFIHDLYLLSSKPNDPSRTEKIKFINPARDFEKLLIKSGAQLISVTKEKKERSHSPPAKKQKSSSSLIPSKDMSKLQSTTPTNLTANNNTNNNSNNNNNVNNNMSSTHSLSQGAANQSSSSSSSKPKSSSKNFIDVFGAPLVFNSQKPSNNNNNNNNANSHNNNNNLHYNHHHHHNHHHQTSARDAMDHKASSTSVNNNDHTSPPPLSSSSSSSHHHSSQPNSHSNSHSKSKSHNHHRSHSHHHSHHSHSQSQPQPQQQQQQQQPQSHKQQDFVTTKPDQFQLIQTRILSLSDCDRLQKIVDIIEEAGEHFSVTPKKFEFDLKRLDKKTISKIERCLQH